MRMESTNQGGDLRLNEIDPGTYATAAFSIAQGGAVTGWVCVQDSPREEWWLMRTGGAPLFVQPSPTSGAVSMEFVFVEGRDAGGDPPPFTGPADFKAWVVAQTGIPPGQWTMAVHAIS